ncbi:hypothetical protein [Paenibacillus odorifer]|uniref:Uncharacterized protein n=1 Tax=Paenibacillus odorifer TaxID=189426 RepID=A0A1R0Y7Z5_9BACL|nr:hypothetical protein [Paenibacillus odorifer]OMD43478.1 hypothetical protein BSK52_03450 [Paenibacillus odorifer]
MDLIVQKTGFKKNFFVNRSIAIPLATAYAINELHRQSVKDDKLMNFKNKHNRPFNVHWKKNYDSLELAMSSSMRTNRALIEQLFYDVLGKKGTAHLTYDLARSLRNHKVNPLKVDSTFSETTKIYIRQMSKDGPVDVTALELFERNEFGYLYYLILKGAMEEDGTYLSTTNETQYIKALQAR